MSDLVLGEAAVALPDSGKQLDAQHGDMLDAPLATADSHVYSYWHLPGESPELYERLGVRQFKRFLPINGDRAGRLSSRLSSGNNDSMKADLEDLVRHSKLIEMVHLGTTAILGVEQYWAHTSDTPVLLQVGMVAAQTVANIYPTMVQRYNRMRAQRVLGRINRRRAD
jgi:hypothetical protein